MDLQKIKALIEVMSNSDLSELEFVEDGWTLRLARASKASARPDQTNGKSARVETPATLMPLETTPPRRPAAVSAELQAPLSGVIYLSPAPGKPPFVSEGQTVKAGTIVCVIEAMKVLNEVRAAHDGRIEAIHIVSGAEVNAGQTLMRIA
jgi:acetyl-CoA carboxylase biotin carboxyl carrier protein